MSDGDLVVLDGDRRRAAGLPASLTVLDRRVALLPADRGRRRAWARPDGRGGVPCRPVNAVGREQQIGPPPRRP
ncbi:hypothetical protein [Nonomuraea angiospora]|uniref:hypothetical protein n=1 Tax=Nonomuraea angiospora TaxID=46172 RepID=UPI0029AB9FC4|nr:hypothetical protein [Nonomuraea angiospora]MDX3105910.1 hypothetical protein [Nonomuraea angiospora]